MYWNEKMFVLYWVNKADYRTKKKIIHSFQSSKKEKSKNICPHVDSGLMRFQVNLIFSLLILDINHVLLAWLQKCKPSREVKPSSRNKVKVTHHARNYHMGDPMSAKWKALGRDCRRVKK